MCGVQYKLTQNFLLRTPLSRLHVYPRFVFEQRENDLKFAQQILVANKMRTTDFFIVMSGIWFWRPRRVESYENSPTGLHQGWHNRDFVRNAPIPTHHGSAAFCAGTQVPYLLRDSWNDT